MSSQQENKIKQHPHEDLQKTYFLQPTVSVLTVEGKDSVDFIHRMSTNDIRDLREGTGKTTIFVNDKGRIIDVVDLYCLNGSIHMVHSSGSVDAVKRVFEKFVIMEDVTVRETSDYTCVLRLSGSTGSKEVFSGEAGSIEMSAPRIYPGGKLYLVNRNNIHDMDLIKNGQSIDIQTYNNYRLEQGIPLFGLDFDESVNPLESNLQEFISWTKGCYVGQEVIARLDTYQKIKRFLKGVVLDSTIPDPYLDRIKQNTVKPIITTDGNNEIGKITSVGYSARMETSILMSRFNKGFEKTGDSVILVIDDSEYTGEIVDLPFVKGEND